MTSTGKKYPKLLVAASFRGNTGAGGYPMIEQLLRGWPRDRIIWWYPGKAEKLKEGMCCESFGPGEIPKWMTPHRRFNEIKCRFFELFYLPRAVRNLRKVIRTEKPDVVWMAPYGFATPIFRKVLNKQIKQKLHVSIHDMADTDGLVKKCGRERADSFQSQLEEIYAMSDSRDCVTAEMSQDLERCTGKKADLIIKYGAEPEQIRALREKSANPPSETPSVIRIGYAGTVIAEETFALFIRALRSIGDRLQCPVEVHLFSPFSYKNKSWFDASLIRERGFLSGDEFTREYARSHWGLSIMHLEDSDPRYNGYSIPCKSTRTLADGIPLICLANKNSTLYKMASTHSLGFVSDSRDEKFIGSELLKLFNEEGSLSKEYVKMAVLLETECNAARNRAALFDLLGVQNQSE
ncbi:MAG: hypothetical protein WCP60_04960 [bacterium]